MTPQIRPIRPARPLRLLARRLRLAALALRPQAGAIVRRSFDVAVASAALVALAPLFVLTALAVKLSSPGPALFFQERVGQHGKRFRMWKFRTMVVGADRMKSALAASCSGASDGGRFKLARDPRVTCIGRVLRKLSIDELPQLVNVLLGDMTLVGPRPPVWREVALYDARALRRLEVRPGLTCLWQVSGRSDLSFDQQVALDLEYIDRTRPIDELRILVRTVPAVLSGRGAY